MRNVKWTKGGLGLSVGATLVVFLELCANPAYAGDRGGNGGTVIVDGQTYELADLHFSPLPSQQLQLDSAMIAAVKTLPISSSYKNYYYPGTPFLGTITLFINIPLDTLVLADTIEYRLLGKLPQDCTPVNNDAGDPIGCSQGSITYIVPKQYSQLSLQEQALDILILRFATIFKGDPTSFSEFGKGLRLFTLRYVPALAAPTSDFKWTQAEQDSLNSMFSTLPKWFAFASTDTFFFTRDGGVLLGNPSDWTIQGNDIRIGLGTFLSHLPDVHPQISGSNLDFEEARLEVGTIQGDTVLFHRISGTITNTHLSNARFTSDGSYSYLGATLPTLHLSGLDATDISVVNSSLTTPGGRVTGFYINNSNVTIPDGTFQVTDFHLDYTTWYCSANASNVHITGSAFMNSDCLIRGKNMTIEKSSLYSTQVIGNDIKISSSTIFGVSLHFDHLNIGSSSLSQFDFFPSAGLSQGDSLDIESFYAQPANQYQPGAKRTTVSVYPHTKITGLFLTTLPPWFSLGALDPPIEIIGDGGRYNLEKDKFSSMKDLVKQP